MKKINTLTMMILLTYSFSIAQELEVQGDLIVTGTIESATIDSMQVVIDSLEAEMASMHGDNQLETRVYTVQLENATEENPYYVDLQLLTGYDLDYAILNILDVLDYQTYDLFLVLESSYQDVNNNLSWKGNYIFIGEYGIDMNASQLGAVRFIQDSSIKINGSFPFTGDILIAVTAQFPD